MSRKLNQLKPISHLLVTFSVLFSNLSCTKQRPTAQPPQVIENQQPNSQDQQKPPNSNTANNPDDNPEPKDPAEEKITKPKISTGEALNRFSLAIAGRPAAHALKHKPEIWELELGDALDAAVNDFFDPTGPNAADVADWVVGILRDQWKIQVVRNDGIKESGTWLMPSTPAVLDFNRSYLKRRPDRRFFDPENPVIFGGEGFDMPPSNDENPGDAGYALYELEPLLVGAYTVLFDQPFGSIVTASETLRSAALDEFSSFLPNEKPKLKPSGNGLQHWSGLWAHGRRTQENNEPIGGGILVSQGFLRSYIKERTWASKGIYESLLCKQISSGPDLPSPIKFDKVGDSNPLNAGQSCKGCHNMLDGLANLRMEYPIDSAGNKAGGVMYYHSNWSKRFKNNGETDLESLRAAQDSNVARWPMTHFLLSDNGTYAPIASMEELGSKISQQEEFHRCQVNAFVRSLVQAETADDQNTILDKALSTYFKNGQSIKSVVRDIVRSEVFLEK
jgi:hypothetical protein